MLWPPLRIKMLRVFSASGHELLARGMEELSDVRALKQDLQELCGLPRFRQRMPGCC